MEEKIENKETTEKPRINVYIHQTNPQKSMLFDDTSRPIFFRFYEGTDQMHGYGFTIIEIEKIMADAWAEKFKNCECY